MDKAFEYLNDNDRALLEKKGEVLEVEKDHVVLEDSMELWVSSSIRTLKPRHKPTSLVLGL